MHAFIALVRKILCCISRSALAADQYRPPHRDAAFFGAPVRFGILERPAYSRLPSFDQEQRDRQERRRRMKRERRSNPGVDEPAGSRWSKKGKVRAVVVLPRVSRRAAPFAVPSRGKPVVTVYTSSQANTLRWWRLLAQYAWSP